MAAKSSRTGNRGWTESEWNRMNPADQSHSEAGAKLWPRVLSARYDAPSQLVVLQLSNGVRFGISAEKLEGVASADDERRAVVTISESANAIEFPQISERFSVAELLTGVFGSRAWLTELERRSAVPAASNKPAVAPKTAAAAKSRRKKSAAPRKLTAKAPKRRAKSK